MTFHSSSEDNDIDFKVKTFLNDAKNWSNFRYKIKLRLNKVNKTKQAIIIEDDGPTVTSVPLQNLQQILTVYRRVPKSKKLGGGHEVRRYHAIRMAAFCWGSTNQFQIS